MKQPTIFDYISKSPKEIKNYQANPLQKTGNIIEQKGNLTKTYIQKNLSQVIKEQEDFHYIKELLGKSWFKQENGFGFTDQENIMVFSTIQDFNNKFFNLHKVKVFIFVSIFIIFFFSFLLVLYLLLSLLFVSLN